METTPHAGDHQHVTPNPADLAAPALLPCPLCGSEEAYTDTGSDCANMPNAGCMECGLHLNARTIAEAIAAWNRRAHPAAPAEVEGLINAANDILRDKMDEIEAEIGRECRDRDIPIAYRKLMWALARLDQPKGGEGKANG